jgi:hypothetical protein
MPAEQLPAEILLPIILRLFPALVRAPIVGRIIPLFNVKQSTDEDLARALARKYKRPERKGFNDDVHVIKVSDAIDCVENVIGDGKVQAAGILVLAKMLFNQSTGGSPIGDKIIECLRDNCLSQESDRTTAKPKQRYHRPSLGHGEGRGKF